MDAGEFSIKGDILDLYTLYSSPVRIEFFADTVEDIRMFDPNTQKALKKLDKIRVYPLHKFLLTEDNKKGFKSKLYKEVQELEKISGESEIFSFYMVKLLKKLKTADILKG